MAGDILRIITDEREAAECEIKRLNEEIVAADAKLIELRLARRDATRNSMLLSKCLMQAMG